MSHSLLRLPGTLRSSVLAIDLMACVHEGIVAQSAVQLPTRGTRFWAGYLQNGFGAQSLKVHILSSTVTIGTVRLPLGGWRRNFSVVAKKRLPGTHAVKILLGATLLAGLAAVIAARSPSDTAGRQKIAEAAVQAQSTTAGTTPGSTATQGQTPVPNSEGAVPEPAEEQLPGSDIVSSASNSRFSMPLKQWSKVTDRYGAKNRGPGLIHGGIDLALEGLSHSNVYAACTDTVSDASYNGTYGNHIFVDCGDGWSTLYGHLSRWMRSSVKTRWKSLARVAPTHQPLSDRR